MRASFKSTVALAAMMCALAGVALAQNVGPTPYGSGNYGPPAISKGSHIVTTGQSQPPSVANCGTGATIVGTDNAFLLTTGTGTTGNSSCTVTFLTPYSLRPICSLDSEGNTAAYTTTQTGVNLTGPIDNTRYHVNCVAQPNGG